MAKQLPGLWVVGVSVGAVALVGVVLFLMHEDQFVSLDLEGTDVDALYRGARENEDGSVELILNIPASNKVIEKLRAKGRLLPRKGGNFTRVPLKPRKTQYPLTMDSPYVINSPDVCKDIKNLTVLYIVHSATDHFQRRRLIRETWANKNLFKDIQMRIVFLFGLTQNMDTQTLIENERTVYGDIVQGKFLDTYHNLTHKGVLAFRWVSEHCPHAELVVKMDDDIFINPFLLLENIYPKYRHKSRYILCHLRKKGTSPIIRNNKSKWQVDEDQFRGYKHYPTTYCNGYMVVISPDIIRAMYRASYLTPFFWVDDVYLYGLLPSKIGQVTYQDIRGNMTLNVNQGTGCYTKADHKCSYLAANVWKEGALETVWYAALQQASPNMKKLLKPELVT